MTHGKMCHQSHARTSGWTQEVHQTDALKIHSQSRDFEGINFGWIKRASKQMVVVEAHTQYCRDSTNDSIKFLSHPNPYPFERYYYHVCVVVYIPVLLPGWEDQPKIAGEDAGIWKGRFCTPNTSRRWWSVLLWLSPNPFQQVLYHLFIVPPKREIGFSPLSHYCVVKGSWFGTNLPHSC